MHMNLDIPFLKEERIAREHEAKLHEHINVEETQILDNQNRRLKRNKQADLV